MSYFRIPYAERGSAAVDLLRASPRSWLAALIAIQGAALGIALWTEYGLESFAAYALFWGLLNGLFLALLRRPLAASALSLVFVVLLVLLSRLKHDILSMTVNFLDLIIIDTDTFAFLLTVFPNLAWMVGLAVLLLLPILFLLFWFDPFRVRARAALLAACACLAGLTGLSFAVPSDPYDEFYDWQYVSKFARSGVTAAADYFAHGLFEADAAVAERLKPVDGGACAPGRKLPHIVMVFDESSFDIGVVPNLKLPPDYRNHFRSFDGKNRTLVVEGAGGPSWYTEYNVLTGLSARSYGRFADFVTRIAAGKVERGLPHALRACGYKTISQYPFWGAFLGARSFQTSTGIEHFLDLKDLGSRDVEHDGFYFDAAARVMARERGEKPMFMFMYTAANHFPWSYRFKPALTPGWRDFGNDPETDEYLRRQSMSARDYAAFVARLKRDFAGEPMLIVRFGDHQPSFARNLIDPRFDDSLQARRIALGDPRFLTTYYTIDTLSFRPADLSSALDMLDAPYLPIVVLEAAGVPLDPSFAEQKRIMQRCNGMFYRCAGGAEVRRFNRLLMDAGLLKRF
jgi:phosphoglycerol transferase MdoB-like AlkP superfamily enzyme